MPALRLGMPPNALRLGMPPNVLRLGMPPNVLRLGMPPNALRLGTYVLWEIPGRAFKQRVEIGQCGTGLSRGSAAGLSSDGGADGLRG